MLTYITQIQNARGSFLDEIDMNTLPVACIEKEAASGLVYTIKNMLLIGWYHGLLPFDYFLQSLSSPTGFLSKQITIDSRSR